MKSSRETKETKKERKDCIPSAEPNGTKPPLELERDSDIGATAPWRDCAIALSELDKPEPGTPTREADMGKAEPLMALRLLREG